MHSKKSDGGGGAGIRWRRRWCRNQMAVVVLESDGGGGSAGIRWRWWCWNQMAVVVLNRTSRSIFDGI
ncbi:hypothetical protein Tco_1244685 [Tanacetum coccineum]